MRTKILGLLLAFLAICNFSLAGDKHPAHSIGFIKAAKSCFDLKDELVPETNPLYTGNENLLTLPKNTNVEMGMVITDARLNSLKHEPNNLVSDNYYWIFNWDDFVKVWNEKWNSEHKTAEKNWLKITDNTIIVTPGNEEKVINRIALLLGLDIQPSHIYICKFKVNSSFIFRPAYTTDIQCEKIAKKGADNMYYFDTKFLNKFGDDEIEVINGEYKLPNPKVYLAHLQQMREYPWTRLGYTYDWGDKNNHQGVFEFVLMPNTELKNLVIYNLQTGEKVMGK